MAARRLSRENCFDVYRSAYRINVDWDRGLEEDVVDWLTIYSKAHNCPKGLVIPALLSLTSTMCGPKTKVQGNGDAFTSTLNSFMFVVADPGAGKSSVFEKVLEPVFEKYSDITGKQMHLENYTTAGIHKQQIENNGYGMVTSDEGHRFLSSVQNKQGKGEAERALLCKIWNGKGDFITLSGGTRGFKETSLSLFILIQPQPFLNELGNMMSGDGLLDRFIVTAVCPTMNSSSIVRQFHDLLKDSAIQSFSDVFIKMYKDHKDSSKIYTLSKEAQETYDILTDNYAEYINNKYNNEEEDDDKENISPSQTEDCFMISSKDTIHILRLACILHILNRYLAKTLNPNLYKDDPVTDFTVSKDSVIAAKMMYHNMSQQKSLFLEAASKVDKKDEIIIGKSKSFKERVVRCVCNQDGPIVLLRKIQRHIKGSLSENIRIELENLQKEDFGKLVVHAKKECFMKPAPTTVTPENLCLKSIKMSIQRYTEKFRSVPNGFSLAELQNHYQYEVIADMFN